MVIPDEHLCVYNTLLRVTSGRICACRVNSTPCLWINPRSCRIENGKERKEKSVSYASLEYAVAFSGYV